MGYIRVYRGDDLIDQFELTTDRLTIGRGAEAGLVLGDAGVSRLHATIVREGGRFFVEDNNSSNGVFVNKQKVERAQLNFWDEIQIYNYVLKFMAVPRRDVEIDKEAAAAETHIDRTMVASIDDAAQLESLRKQKKVAWLVQRLAQGREQRFPLKAGTFTCGRAKNCDVRVGGWFAPKFAASVERNGAAYQLVPGKRGQVVLNNKVIAAPQELQDADRFRVGGAEFEFFNRVEEA